MTHSKDQESSPTKGPAKAPQENQTPAVDHPGQYTAEKAKEQDQSSEQSGVEGSPNQGTESR
ncbi:hypothetical protein IQ268_20400 [Oculatella sp. LEGE 06141]|uniref:hypothetical protein n=1 Tax=Oculatella sp. LEGE 06141 TaxID=1828648 RepID=UPI001882C50A|nr:hypothetical protein [Oculatella sp. LEGE 06141]MBE9180924.1 hypothetical protein [Oculatella sp. LEGE 06141]